MTERFSADLVFILVVLLVSALLGFIIGYLLKKNEYLKVRKMLEDEIEQLKIKLQASHEEIEQLKIKLDTCHQEKLSLIEAINAKDGIAFDAKAAAAVFGKKINKDDLKIVEGIGEKIESILKERGIDTWFKLSKSEPDKIKEILLEVGGPSYSMHEPGTWPKQALLMCEGKWVELKAYQDELIGGK
jgi:predicted flap endonuclease-1-like 5' DNA nuclease